MKKRQYITPTVQVVPVQLEGIICDSYHEMPIGGRGDDFAAPSTRRNGWDEYENGY